jgi:hypothetical protein
MTRSGIGRDRVFQGFDLGAQDEFLGLDDLFHDEVDLATDLVELSLEIQ